MLPRRRMMKWDRRSRRVIAIDPDLSLGCSGHKLTKKISDNAFNFSNSTNAFKWSWLRSSGVYETSGRIVWANEARTLNSISQSISLVWEWSGFGFWYWPWSLRIASLWRRWTSTAHHTNGEKSRLWRTNIFAPIAPPFGLAQWESIDTPDSAQKSHPFRSFL